MLSYLTRLVFRALRTNVSMELQLEWKTIGLQGEE